MWHPIKRAISILFLLAFLIPFLLFLILRNKILLLNFDLYLSSSSPLSLSLIFDIYGITLILVVLFIAFNVLLFTVTYIKDDKYLPRFTGLVISFILAICLLVIFPNIFTLLIGWDGLGLTSYLLVLYYQSPKSYGAAIITAITNRVGDVLILFLIAWCLNTHWLPISPWTTPAHSFIAAILIIAAMTKRAQLPFIRWLPAAIAAPTPVSALVHSSTLVTAGIFILIRFFNFIHGFQSLEFILLFSASLTACIAGLRALTECDIKKIIALSTLSQLGTIIYSLSINSPNVAFFHLITHALFKALLFITAGTLIHFHHHSQDLRTYGHLPGTMPFFSRVAIVSNAALCGMPFSAGFYSKDLIIEAHVSRPMSYLLILVFFFATSLTAIYTTRFLTNLIFTARQTPPASLFLPSLNITTMAPMFFLSQATIVVGASLSWALYFPQPEATLPLILKVQALIAGLRGIMAGTLLSAAPKKSSNLSKLPLLNAFFTELAFTTPINAQATAQLPLTSGHILHKTGEGGWVEILGGQGTITSLSAMSRKLSSTLSKSLPLNLAIFVLLASILIIL